MVGVLFFFVAVMVVPGYAIAISASVFVLYGPVRLAWEKWYQHRHREEPLF